VVYPAPVNATRRTTAIIGAACLLVLVGCGKDRKDVKDDPAKPDATAPVKKTWPWKPLKASAIKAAGAMEGPHAGWNPDDNTFGLCQWECADRQSDHELECYVGKPNAKGEPIARLTDTSDPTSLETAGILATPTGDAKKPFGTATLKTTSKTLEEHCEWELTAVDVSGSTKVLAQGRVADCIEAPTFNAYASPDRKAYALWVEHSGDHGCAGNDVLVLTVPP